MQATRTRCGPEGSKPVSSELMQPRAQSRYRRRRRSHPTPSVRPRVPPHFRPPGYPCAPTPTPRPAALLLLQVYQRVESTGEDFLQHFKSNFRVHLVSLTEEEVV